MSLSAVIFDMDGVIIDSEPVYYESNNELFHELGFSVTKDEYQTFVGKSARKIWSDLKKKHGLPQSVDDLVKRESSHFLSKLRQITELKPIDGVQSLITSIHNANIPTALASSSTRECIDIVLRRLNLMRYFNKRVSGEDVQHGKPNPDIFIHTAELLGISSHECLVIEDSHNGVRAAKSAGMYCIAYKNPNTTGEQDLSSADMIISDYAEVDLNSILQK